MLSAGDLISDGTAVFKVGDIKQDATKTNVSNLQVDLGELETTVSNLVNTVNNLLPKYTFTKNLTLAANTWTDVEISGNNLPTGVYILYFYSTANPTSSSLWSERFTGLVAWYNGGTNSSNANNITLHSAGHANNSCTMSARTIRSANSASNPYLRLQIHSNLATTACDWVFVFRKII